MNRIKQILFCLALTTGPLAAWDIPGHMIVAQIAYGQLNSNAMAHLTRLAGEIRLGQHTYNAINIAAWPDEIKTAAGPEHGHYRQWHYIDLGCPDSHFELLTNPEPLRIAAGDVVSALK